MPDPTDDTLDNTIIVDGGNNDDPSNGGTNMPAIDIDDGAYQELVEEDLRAFSNASQEHEGNAEAQSALVNFSGGKKFAKEDAIEAASVEMILQRNV